MKRLEESLKEISTLDKRCMSKCQEIWDSKMKPKGSLGVMEDIVLKLSGIFRESFEDIKLRGCHIVAAADNGIVQEGVSSCPAEYTRIVSEAMCDSLAAIGIMCDNLGVDLKVVDVGIKEDISREYKNLYKMKVMYGSNNFSKSLAMGLEETVATIENGIIFMEELEGKYDIFSTGEMGIGNTTTSSAILYSLTKSSLDNVVGEGSGLSMEHLFQKKKVIFESCIKYNTFQLDTLEILSAVGGLDIAFLVGVYIGAAKARKLILVDGFISSVAALVACKLNPLIKEYLLITHISDEPGMKIVLEELDLKPFLQMHMRLGEGTGAVLAYPIISSALKIYKTMKTPEEIYNLFGR